MLVVESSCKTRRSGKVKIMDDRARSDPRGERSSVDGSGADAIRCWAWNERKEEWRGGRGEEGRSTREESRVSSRRMPSASPRGIAKNSRKKSSSCKPSRDTRPTIFFKVSFPPYRLDNSGGKGTANVLEFSKLVTQLLVSGLFLHAIWFLFFFSLFSFVSLYARFEFYEKVFFLLSFISSCSSSCFFLLFFSYCDFNFLINF